MGAAGARSRREGAGGDDAYDRLARSSRCRERHPGGARARAPGGGSGARMSAASYIILIFAGFVIGLVAAVPIGPVNLLCVRRTVAYGSLYGFLSGLGAAVADGVFASIVGFGLTAISDMIKNHVVLIE